MKETKETLREAAAIGVATIRIAAPLGRKRQIELKNELLSLPKGTHPAIVKSHAVDLQRKVRFELSLLRRVTTAVRAA